MATPTEQPTPSLQISTLVKRHPVTIDGKTYELRNQDEFTYLGARQQRRMFRRVGELMTRMEKGLKPKEEKELERLLTKFVEAVLIAPPAVRSKLSIVNLWQLVIHFSTLLRQTPTAGAAQMAAQQARRRKR